ncbi:MAG: MBOAT family O-acyltransferase [Mesobacillus sp.]
MLFNSYTFIFFFLPIVFIGYFALLRIKPVIGKAFLVLSSFFFYGYWNESYLFLIIGSILVNFFFGKILSRENISHLIRKLVVSVGIAINIALLGYYKYSDFFIENFNSLFNLDQNLLNLALPLAISFFTFQQIAFLVDSYRLETKDYNILDYSLFVTFFPQLIAGPIVHHSEIMPQFNDKNNWKLNYANISRGLYIFGIGLFKKVIIADTFALWANDGYNNMASLSLYDSWVTTLSYTFQLYFDFSAYCDMAIGIGLLFNIVLPINFNSPYKSLNIQEFWKRWHITLGRFFTQYVYIPLGGNRKGQARTYFNLFLIFFISGFWHGAGWTFIVWGAMHGFASILYRWWSRTGLSLPKVVSWFITFMFIHIAWVYFRAISIDQANVMIEKMFSFHNLTLPEGLSQTVLSLTGRSFPVATYFFSLDLAIVLAMGLLVVFFAKNSIAKMNLFQPSIKHAVATAFFFVASVLYLNRVSEFLYFNF